MEYDPTEVSYRDLVRIFFTIHDPTTKDRQGNDIGTQYRSAIYYTDDTQRTTALEVMDEVRQAGLAEQLVTELGLARSARPRVPRHYYARNPNQGYCARSSLPNWLVQRQY